MAEYGEWNRKGATLSSVTAKAEYGVGWDLIVKGVNAGKLEYREGSIWGNPYLKIVRSQLEAYIAERLGEPYLVKAKAQTELRKIKKLNRRGRRERRGRNGQMLRYGMQEEKRPSFSPFPEDQCGQWIL